jgi:hexosaminidase
VAYPDLAATPGPFALARGPGIAKVALDPEREEVHEFLADLLTEVVDLFPDPYLHIGGDEVDPDAWPHLADPRAAQARFTERTAALVRSLGRIPIVWDEAWHPDLAPDVVSQVWRGQGLARASAAEHRPTLFSSPYYLDLSFDPRHHRVDPLTDARGWAAARADLRADATVGALGQLIAAVEDGYPTPPGTPDETDPTSVLGGEACLWTELCPQPLFHLRVWPVAGAVADTLWSGPPVLDPGTGETADGAAQLDRFAAVLAATTAVDVEADRRAHWLELAGGDTDLADAVAVLATCCEPIKWYSRHLVQTDPEQAPSLDRFVDALPPTATARRLPPDPTRWRAAAALLLARVDAPERVAELRPVAERLLAVCDHVEDPAAADPGIAPIGEILVTASLPIAPARG